MSQNKKMDEHFSFDLDAVGELPTGICPVVNDFAEVQAKRRAEGRCVHCGELLEMKWTGIQDCKVCNP